jgi:hypothetical protein
MRSIYRILLLPWALLVSGCAILPYSGDPVELPKLIDAVKCELNYFYKTYTYRNDENHRGFAISDKTGGTLDIKTQLTNTASGSLAATAPFSALPFLATLGFSASYNGSVTTDIKLLIDQYTEKKYAVTACTDDGAYVDKSNRVVMVNINGLRLHDWLGKFVKSETLVIRGTPRIQLQTLTITTAFTYTETENAGIVSLIPHWTGPSLSGSQSDAQTLTLTINGTAKPSKDTSEKTEAALDPKKLMAKIDAQADSIKKLSDRLDQALPPAAPSGQKRTELLPDQDRKAVSF